MQKPFRAWRSTKHCWKVAYVQRCEPSKAAEFRHHGAFWACAVATLAPSMKIETIRTFMTPPAQPTRPIADRYRRSQPIARARQSFIASNPREGRVMRACRRALVSAGARPLMTRDLLRWAYPHLDRFQCWHYWSIYRAAPRYAVKNGRVWLPR